MHKAIYFDLDNTLTHRSKSIWKYSINIIETFRLTGMFNTDTLFKTISFHDNGGYLQKNSIYQYVRDAVPCELHKLISEKISIDLNDLREHWIDIFPECSEIMEGAGEVLYRLQEQKFYLGVISNGAQISRVKTIDSLGFGRYFNQIVSSELIGIKKPNPEIFTKVAADAGFDTHECIYIGDHPLNDVEGSRNAGMTSIWLQGFHDWPTGLQPASHSIKSLGELVEKIKLLNNFPLA